MSEVLDLMAKLKKASDVYLLSSRNDRRVEIYKACEFLFKRLEELRVPRSFSETFLCYGDRFLEAEFGIPFTKSKNGEYYLNKLC